MDAGRCLGVRCPDRTRGARERVPAPREVGGRRPAAGWEGEDEFVGGLRGGGSRRGTWPEWELAVGGRRTRPLAPAGLWPLALLGSFLDAPFGSWTSNWLCREAWTFGLARTGSYDHYCVCIIVISC